MEFSATEEAGVPSRVPDEESKAKRIETLESHLLEAQSEIRNLTLVAEKAELAKKEADANFIALKAKYSKAQEKLVWAYEVMQNMFANYKLFDADMQRSSKDFGRLFKSTGFDAKPVPHPASSSTSSKQASVSKDVLLGEPSSSTPSTTEIRTLLSDSRSFPSAFFAANTKPGGSKNTRATLEELRKSHPSLDLNKMAIHLLETAYNMIPLDCDVTPPHRCYFGKQKNSGVYVVFPTETMKKATAFQWINDDDQVVCGPGGKTNILLCFAKLYEDVAIEKTEFYRLTKLLKRSKDQILLFGSVPESGDENDSSVMSMCLKLREIIVNALWPEPFQPFIQKVEGLWKRNFHTKRLKAMEVCAKLAVSETWKDDGDFDPQTINTVGKIVLDGVVNNFCEARFEFKKNSLRKAMQEVVRKETLLLVNQKDVGPLMLAANSEFSKKMKSFKEGSSCGGKSKRVAKKRKMHA